MLASSISTTGNAKPVQQVMRTGEVVLLRTAGNAAHPATRDSRSGGVSEQQVMLSLKELHKAGRLGWE